MNLDSLIGPAVVAAIVSGLVTAVAMWVNRSTSLTTHREKIKADHALAESKVAGDLKLAERKFALDRLLQDLNRKTELAEQVLSDFYKARDIFLDARRSFAFSGEGTSRPNRGIDETEAEARYRDSIYAPYERLSKEREFFAEMHSRRFRFMAHFGEKGEEPFLAFLRSFNEVGAATRLLLESGDTMSDDRRKKYETIIGWSGHEDDEMAARLVQALTDAEAICAPTLRDNVKLTES